MADSTRAPDSDHARRTRNARTDLSTYSGCWVALVNGRVAATGKTARAALLAARTQRLKDEPSLIWAPAKIPNVPEAPSE